MFSGVFTVCVFVNPLIVSISANVGGYIQPESAQLTALGERQCVLFLAKHQSILTSYLASNVVVKGYMRRDASTQDGVTGALLG